MKPLINDLEAQRRAIVDQVAARMPAEGLDLMWRFLRSRLFCVRARRRQQRHDQRCFQCRGYRSGEIARTVGPDPKQRGPGIQCVDAERLRAVRRDDPGAAACSRSSGTIYADEIAESTRVNTVRRVLQEIVDTLGDVGSFIAQYDEPVRKVPKIAATARRLLAVGRTDDAWRTIEANEQQPGGWPERLTRLPAAAAELR